MTRRRRRTAWNKRRRGQLEIDLRPRTKRGTLRKKLGRPVTGRRMDPRHRTRPELDPKHPVHVVLRVTREVSNLRTRHAYRAIRRAVDRCRARADFRVTHMSIQSNHIHLLVEADDKDALRSGMQGFAISAARRLNRELRRPRGHVFAFRYHATAITNPRQARNAICYIVNNWRHHRCDRHVAWQTDPYSSAHAIADWRVEPHPDQLPVVRPTTWLLREGYKRAMALRPDEIPGPDPTP
ncbi:MAG TPA: transposase [Kofleriaceae bacterium]|jgi:REP element-mobilizing transposase RayT|nr:transposase [Kofleriaceae bacterium]